jgi:NAD(P)-dependent dehydrogenase (short-subunit alcohol dehydrogenase family)
MKKRIELVIIGGSGLVGSTIINKFLNKNKTVLNLDIINKLDKNDNYFFKKFDMSSNKLKNNLENIFKNYTYPRVFIDCSYIDRAYFKNASIEKISKNQLDLILKRWLSSTVVISSHILNNMKKNKIKGSVILTGSIYGFVAQDNNVYKKTKIDNNIAYSLVKSGINNLVKNAAVRFGKFGIRVNSVCPGGVYSIKDKNFRDKNFTKNYLSKVPLKRFASSTDLADAYFFLSSNKSSYITGVNLLVDGGYTLV